MQTAAGVRLTIAHRVMWLKFYAVITYNISSFAERTFEIFGG